MSESYEMSVAGMNCMHCAGAVTRAVEAVVGTQKVMVSLDEAKVSFEVETSDVPQRVRDAIQAAGYIVSS